MRPWRAVRVPSAAATEDDGHASITVTAHIYADFHDDEVDEVASALDALDDRQSDERLRILALPWP
jgi:hypothetical protein